MSLYNKLDSKPKKPRRTASDAVTQTIWVLVCLFIFIPLGVAIVNVVFG